MKKQQKNYQLPTKRLSKIYLRLLLSYTAVLLIPLLVLTYFYSSLFMKQFYKEIYNTVDSELVQFGNQMDNELESMESIVNHLSMSETLSQTTTASSPLDLKPVVAELSNYCSANPFLLDAVIIMKDQPYIVTSSTTAPKDYYFKYLLVPHEQQDGTSLDYLLDESQPVCVPSQSLLNFSLTTTPQDTLIFSFPVFTDYQQQIGTILFLVSNQSVQEFRSKRLESYQAQLYVTDQNQTVLTSIGASPEAMSSDSDQYIIRSWSSKKTGWSFLVYLPDKQDTFAQVSSISRSFIFSIVITLFLACLVIYILSRLNYAPIRNLLNKSRQILPTVPEQANELDSISNALDYLSVQNEALSTKLSSSLNAVKNERLFRLLSGKYDSRQDFNLDCSELELYLPKGFCTVAIMKIHTPVPDLELLTEEIQNYLAIPYLYHCVHSLHPDDIIFLVTHQNKDDGSCQVFEKALLFLSSKKRLSATVGIGSAVESTDCIMQSYMEASSALDYRFIKGNETVIQFQEVISLNQSNTIYPLEEFTLLKNSLFSKNTQGILSSIQQIISFIEENPMPLYLARSICFDLVRLVKKQFEMKNGESPLLKLSDLETAQEITSMLKNWSSQLKELPPEKQRSSINEIMDYLEKQVLNPDFSVYEAAEYFKMSLPSFSKYFKESTGQNVMDYTIQTRIQKARELLINTTLPLKDISEQVGYYNVSSFTRRFKLNQGCTPGEYRKSNATKSKTTNP